jgi:hypothetical protein
VGAIRRSSNSQSSEGTGGKAARDGTSPTFIAVEQRHVGSVGHVVERPVMRPGSAATDDRPPPPRTSAGRLKATPCERRAGRRVGHGTPSGVAGGPRCASRGARETHERNAERPPGASRPMGDRADPWSRDRSAWVGPPG